MLHAFEDLSAHDAMSTLHWREQSDRHWIASAPGGGYYELVPKQDGQVEAWYVPGPGKAGDFLARRSTLGGAIQASNHHLGEQMRPSRAAESASEGCEHTHPASVPVTPCPDPSLHHTEIEDTEIVSARKRTLKASESGKRPSKVSIACERPAPLGARETAPYARSTRDPKEIEEGRALGPARSAQDVYRIVGPSLSKESQEVFLVLPVDLRGQLQCKPVEVARGQRDHVTVNKSDIFRPVIEKNAMGFIVVHVHPSGHAKPSPEDKRLTAALCKAMEEGALDSEVKLVDHVIVASSHKKGEFYSFRENGHIVRRCSWSHRTVKKTTIHKVAHPASA
jgi:hypothetical protein